MDAVELSSNIRDHGSMADAKGKRAVCNYCQKNVSDFSRLKCHLGHVGTDVTHCEKVSLEVMEMMRNVVFESRRKRENKTVERLPKSQSKKARTGSTDVRLNFFTGASLTSLLAATSSERTGIDEIVDRPQIMSEIPSCEELQGWILERELEDMKSYVSEIRHSWTITGCSIILDGWISANGRSLMNILVDCPKGPIYLRSCDISAFSDGVVDGMESVIDEAIKEIGADNVVQIVTYSIKTWMLEVGKRVVRKHKTIIWSASASCCLQLILEEIGNMNWVKTIINQAKTLTRFFHSDASIFSFMDDHINWRDLVNPSKFNSVKPFLALESTVLKRNNLEGMLKSPGWITSAWASTTTGQDVVDLLYDPSFWDGAEMVLKAVRPIIQVLCHLNNPALDKPQTGHIYEIMDQAKEAIKAALDDNEDDCRQFWELIDEVWDNNLHSILHAAGYHLNPLLYYSSGDSHIDSEVESGFLNCVVRMVHDRRIQEKMHEQVIEYRTSSGTFKKMSRAVKRSSSISPPLALWWRDYGGQCPELQIFANRILSQTCDGALRYGLKRNMAEKLLGETKSCIEWQRLNELTFVHYNLQLRHFSGGKD